MDRNESVTLLIAMASGGGFEEFIALIEISNVHNSNMVANAGRGRFTVVGAPIVAVDLINTVAAPGPSTGEDLLLAEPDAEAWWRIERGRVPGEDLLDIRG